MEFRFKEVDPNALIVTVDGGLDRTTSVQFVDAIEKMIATGLCHIIVDCGKLRYISSYGIGTLIRLHKRMRKRGGDVKLASLHGVVWDVLRTASLDKVFNIYPNVERARLAFRPKDSENAPPKQGPTH